MRLFIWIWGSPEWGAPDAEMGCSAQDTWDEIGEYWHGVQNLKKKLPTCERLDHSVSKGKILKTLCCSLGLGPISAWLRTIIKKRGNIRATR